MPTKREQQILNMIRENPMISQKELADALGITRPGVASHISHLIKEGYINGKGYILPNQDDYVTVIGATNMDIFSILQDNEVMPLATNPGKIRVQLGGMGRNIAANLSALGIKTNLITAFGDDPYGQLFKRDAIRRSINLDYACQLNTQPTSIYLYINRRDGKRLIATDDLEINQHITPDMLRQSIVMINHSKLVIFDSNLPVQTISWLYENIEAPLMAKAVSVRKVTNLRQPNAKLQSLIINGMEASVLTKQNITDMSSALNCARQLQEMFKTQVTLYVDNLGIVVDDGVKHVYEKYPKLTKIHSNGVGTSIVASVAYAFLHQKDIDKTLTMAMDASRITARSAQNVSDEIKNIID